MAAVVLVVVDEDRVDVLADGDGDDDEPGVAIPGQVDGVCRCPL